LGENRKGLEAELQVLRHRRARAPAVRPEQQILLHREPREKPPSLGHERDAEVHDLLGREAREVVLDAVDRCPDDARDRRHDAHDAFHQRALAVAVGAEQGHRLPVVHRQRMRSSTCTAP